MKKVLLALALCVSFSGMAQLVNVTSIDKVNIPENAASKVAAISPQGDYILMTTDYNCGLTKFDLATGATQVITRAQGAGHDAQISQDGSTVVYRERSTNKKHLQMKAVKTKNLATGAEQQLVKPSRDLQGVAIDGNTAVAVNKGKMSKKALDNGKAQVNTPVLSTNNFKLYITRNGKTTEFMPAGNHRYIWASMSPDATKVLFYCSGKGEPRQASSSQVDEQRHGCGYENHRQWRGIYLGLNCSCRPQRKQSDSHWRRCGCHVSIAS